jgi:hypothetical protein
VLPWREVNDMSETTWCYVDATWTIVRFPATEQESRRARWVRRKAWRAIGDETGLQVTLPGTFDAGEGATFSVRGSALEEREVVLVQAGASSGETPE